MDDSVREVPGITGSYNDHVPPKPAEDVDETLLFKVSMKGPGGHCVVGDGSRGVPDLGCPIRSFNPDTMVMTAGNRDFTKRFKVFVPLDRNGYRLLCERRLECRLVGCIPRAMTRLDEETFRFRVDIPAAAPEGVLTVELDGKRRSYCGKAPSLADLLFTTIRDATAYDIEDTCDDEYFRRYYGDSVKACMRYSGRIFERLETGMQLDFGQADDNGLFRISSMFADESPAPVFGIETYELTGELEMVPSEQDVRLVPTYCSGICGPSGSIAALHCRHVIRRLPAEQILEGLKSTNPGLEIKNVE